MGAKLVDCGFESTGDRPVGCDISEMAGEGECSPEVPAGGGGGGGRLWLANEELGLTALWLCCRVELRC